MNQFRWLLPTSLQKKMGDPHPASSLELTSPPLRIPNRLASPPNPHEDDDPAPADPNKSAIRASLLADDAALLVPDGGYGWAVVLGCAVLSWWFVGTSYSWGVIQAALVQSRLSSASTLSFVGSLTVAAIAVLALVNARVVRAIGARRTGLLGVVLLGSGEVLSGFSTRSVGWLFVTAGVVTGLRTRFVFPLGFCVCYGR